VQQADTGDRRFASKHVDSLMVYYDASVVSLGKTAVKGTSDLRRHYDEAVKTNVHDASFQSVAEISSS
jgi:hypothetical protein